MQTRQSPGHLPDGLVEFGNTGMSAPAGLRATEGTLDFKDERKSLSVDICGYVSICTYTYTEPRLYTYINYCCIEKGLEETMQEANTDGLSLQGSALK